MTAFSKLGLISSTLLATTLTAPSIAEETKTSSSFSEALAESKPLFAARLRYETVDQDNALETADALTYRFRVGVETGSFLGTKFLVDIDHIEDIMDDFNSTTNGKGTFSVVPDPNSTELNRLQLTNTSIPDTTVTLGRQRIILDDARFVGNVGWRQNEQTYDALRVVNTSVDKLKIDVAYINGVNRIFGDESAAGTWTGDSYIANVSYDTPAGKLTGFGYFLDFEEAAGASTQTLGVRFAGAQAIGPGKLGYTLSYALQEDWGSSPLDYETDYFLADLKYTINKFTGEIGYEQLGSDSGTQQFRTPLATLHKFGGWSDVLLNAPPTGLEDLHIRAGYKIGDVGPFKGWGAKVAYHDFSSAFGGIDYGTEINLVTSAKIGKYTLLLKYADYSAYNLAVDTSKLWAQIDFKF